MAYTRSRKLENVVLLGFLIIALFSFCSFNQSEGVYICTGPTAYAYHKTTNCKGLRRCKGDIQKISLGQAKAENRKACKLCYKKR